MDMRVWLQMNQDIPQADKFLNELVFDQMPNAMALLNAELSINLDVDVSEIFQAGLAYPQLFN